MFLEIKELKKSYSDKTVLDISDFSLSKGIYWLRGPNGSGKTTLSKILSGIIPCEGTVTINNQVSLQDHPQQYRLLVNYGEAEPQFPGFLTAADLIYFYARPKKASDNQIKKLIRNFGIDPFLNQPCGTYSSGMLKRLSLVLAFLGNPALVILDEPQNALDADGKELLDRWIYKCMNENDISFILASHEDINSEITDMLFIRNQKLVTTNE